MFLDLTLVLVQATVIDQQSYWNNIIGSVESQNLEGHQTNNSDSAIQYGNEAHQDGGVLGVGRLHLGRGQARARRDDANPWAARRSPWAAASTD